MTREYTPAGYRDIFLFHKIADALGEHHHVGYGRFDNTSNRFWYEVKYMPDLNTLDPIETAVRVEYDTEYCKVTTFKGSSQGAKERMDLVDSVLSEKGYVPR